MANYWRKGKENRLKNEAEHLAWHWALHGETHKSDLDSKTPPHQLE